MCCSISLLERLLDFLCVPLAAISIPDWAIAVIVVGVLAIIALVFCFLGVCFACHTSNHKGEGKQGKVRMVRAEWGRE